MATTGSAAAGAVAKQTGMEKAVALFQPIFHPMLRSVDPVKVSRFLRDRERYEMEVKDKKKEIPSLTTATYKVSVDPGMLRRMHFLGKFRLMAPHKAVDELTSTHIDTWVRDLVRKENVSYDPATTEKALSSLRVPMSIADPEARIMEYCNDFFTRLESVGYEDCKEDNPKKTIQLLQERLFPKTLKNVMQQALEYEEPLRKDVVAYVEVLCEKARVCEKYKGDNNQHNKENLRGSGNGNDVGDASRSQAKKPRKVDGKRSNGKGSASKQRPLRLNPICENERRRHFVIDECEWTSKKHGEKLLDELKAKKTKEQREKNANRVTAGTDENCLKSTIVQAVFAKRVSNVICADGGSDINLIPPQPCQDLLEKRAKVLVTNFEKTRRFGLAAQNNEKWEEIFVNCGKEAVMNVDLIISHGCYVELRNVKWYEATNDMSEPILGRSILEGLGIHTRDLLVAAVDKGGPSVDVADMNGMRAPREGSVARILKGGLDHQDRGMAGEFSRKMMRTGWTSAQTPKMKWTTLSLQHCRKLKRKSSPERA